MSVLSVEGLEVVRAGTRILRGVNWRVESGQRWVVLGPNGSGKTSLIQCLLGQLSASAGEIGVLGERYGRSDWRLLRGRVAVVSSALRTQVLAGEAALNLIVGGMRGQLNLEVMPTAREAELARQAALLAGVAHPLQREWAFLSQGERQRVLLARGYAQRPSLLLLDEPCAGLDPVARALLLRQLDEGVERQPPTVLVTHHLEEVGAAVSHALLLREGRVLEAGPIEEVLTQRALSRLYGRRVCLRGQRGAWHLDVEL